MRSSWAGRWQGQVISGEQTEREAGNGKFLKRPSLEGEERGCREKRDSAEALLWGLSTSLQVGQSATRKLDWRSGMKGVRGSRGGRNKVTEAEEQTLAWWRQTEAENWLKEFLVIKFGVGMDLNSGVAQTDWKADDGLEWAAEQLFISERAGSSSGFDRKEKTVLHTAVTSGWEAASSSLGRWIPRGHSPSSLWATRWNNRPNMWIRNFLFCHFLEKQIHSDVTAKMSL